MVGDLENSSSGNKGVFKLTDRTLEALGCRNCVWKSYGKCPEGFTEKEQSTDKGWGDDLAKFLISLAEDGDSITAVKEKFFLFLQENQLLEDHADYHRAVKDLEDAKERGLKGEDLAPYNQKVLGYKLWWTRLADATLKRMSKVVDRERRSDDSDKDRKAISIQQLNKLIKKGDKLLEADGGQDAKSE